MLKNGAASVIPSSDTVGGGRRGLSFEGAFIDNFYLLGGVYSKHYGICKFSDNVSGHLDNLISLKDIRSLQRLGWYLLKCDKYRGLII